MINNFPFLTTFSDYKNFINFHFFTELSMQMMRPNEEGNNNVRPPGQTSGPRSQAHTNGPHHHVHYPPPTTERNPIVWPDNRIHIRTNNGSVAIKYNNRVNGNLSHRVQVRFYREYQPPQDH